MLVRVSLGVAVGYIGTSRPTAYGLLHVGLLGFLISRASPALRLFRFHYHLFGCRGLTSLLDLPNHSGTYYIGVLEPLGPYIVGTRRVRIC